MKKILLIGLFAFVGLISSNGASAQLRDTLINPIGGPVVPGQYIDLFGYQVGSGTSIITVPVDSLQTSDTLVNVIPFNRTGACWPYLTWYWDKVGSGTATLTISFQQGNDPTNVGFVVRKGVLDSVYSRTYTLSASGWNVIDFKQDTANFSGRYLYIRLQTTSTANVGGKVYARMKTNAN